MTEQPRDENGRFTDLDQSGVVPIDDRDVIAETTEDHVTPRVEYTTVTIDLLEEAIENAKTTDNVVRLGTINREKEKEMGLVLLKPARSSENVTVLAGRKHPTDDGDDE